MILATEPPDLTQNAGFVRRKHFADDARSQKTRRYSERDWPSITKISGSSGVPEHEPAPEESAERAAEATPIVPLGDPLTIAPRQPFAEANCASRIAARRNTQPSHQQLGQILLRISETTSRDMPSTGRTNRQEMKTSWLFHEMNRLATDNRQTAAIKPLYSEPPSARLLLEIHRLPTTTTKNSQRILTNPDQRSTEGNKGFVKTILFEPILLVRAVWPKRKYLRESLYRQPTPDRQQCREVDAS